MIRCYGTYFQQATKMNIKEHKATKTSQAWPNHGHYTFKKFSKY